MGSAEEIAHLLDLLNRGILTREEYGQAMDQVYSAAVPALAESGVGTQPAPPPGMSGPGASATGLAGVGVAGAVSSGPVPPNPVAMRPPPGPIALTITEFPKGALRVNRGRAETEAMVIAVAQGIGLSVSSGPRSVLLVNGKTWKHNAARLSIELQDEPMGSTALFLGKATAHLGPGTAKLQREFLAALREQVTTSATAR
jgi:hypothetical protein